MNASLKRAILQDAWVQVFALLALICGLLSFGYFSGRQEQAAPEPVAMARPTSRIPGRWVVDPRGGPGVDGVSLSAVLANARDGQSIELRPGVYTLADGKLSKSVSLVGQGAHPDDVAVSVAGWRPLVVSSGRVAMKNMRVNNELDVRGAELNLSNVHAEGPLLVSGRSLVAVAQSTFSAIGVRGEGAYLSLQDSAVYAGLEISRGGSARVLRGIIENRTGPFYCAVSINDGLVTLDQSMIFHSRYGVLFSGAGTLEAWNSRFLDLAQGAVSVPPALKDSVVIRGGGNENFETKQNWGVDYVRP